MLTNCSPFLHLAKYVSPLLLIFHLPELSTFFLNPAESAFKNSGDTFYQVSLLKMGQLNPSLHQDPSFPHWTVNTQEGRTTSIHYYDRFSGNNQTFNKCLFYLINRCNTDWPYSNAIKSACVKTSRVLCRHVIQTQLCPLF